MTADNSTSPPLRSKPEKPRPDFPLFAEAGGVWAKKIRGKMHYVGSWDDPQAALDKYLEEKDALHAGRKPREDTGGATVKQVANRFLNEKKALVNVGELSPRTWTDYELAGELIVSAFGKGRLVADLAPDDFAALRNRMAKQWGPHMLGRMIQCVRSIFKHGYESGMIDKPVRYGPGFKRPSKKVLRVHKAKQDVKLFEADELRRMIDAAPGEYYTSSIFAVAASPRTGNRGARGPAPNNVDEG